MILVSGQKLLDLIATDAPFIPYPIPATGRNGSS